MESVNCLGDQLSLSHSFPGGRRKLCYSLRISGLCSRGILLVEYGHQRCRLAERSWKKATRDWDSLPALEDDERRVSWIPSLR